MYTSFEAIVVKPIYDTLSAGYVSIDLTGSVCVCVRVCVCVFCELQQMKCLFFHSKLFCSRSPNCM